MRTIKFRAWSEECYDEENDSYVFEMISADRLAISENNLLQDQLKQTEKFRLMQFTGLQDKNGKEIYEGDIIFNEEENINVMITWWQDAAAFYMFIGNEGVPFSWIIEKNMCYCEVIGDIHENPELIK